MNGKNEQSAVLEQPTVLELEGSQEHREDNRFEGIQTETVQSGEKPLEVLVAENDAMKRQIRRLEQERAERRGATETEALGSTIDNIYADKNKGIHEILKKRKHYDAMSADVAAQLAYLSIFIRGFNAVAGKIGYQTPKYRELKETAELLSKAANSGYKRQFDGIIERAGLDYLRIAEQSVELAGQELLEASSKKENLITEIESLEYRAQERAVHIKSWRTDVDSYEKGIADTQNQLNNLKIKAGRSPSPEDAEAIRLYESKLKAYRENKTTARKAIDSSLISLEDYHADLEAKKNGQLVYHETIEAQLQKDYLNTRRDLAIARDHMKKDEISVGFFKIFDVIRQVQNINAGLNELGKVAADYTQETVAALQEGSLPPGGQRAPHEMTDLIQQTRAAQENLIEKYLPKDFA